MFLKLERENLDMARGYNPSTQEMEVGSSGGVQGQFALHSTFWGKVLIQDKK